MDCVGVMGAVVEGMLYKMQEDAMLTRERGELYSMQLLP
jgi:hypothetical protein